MPGNSLPKIDFKKAEGELCRRNFYEFVKAVWHLVDPSPFKESKYIEVICTHLQWVYETGNSLVINIPPRHGKSIIVCVLWHGWIWANDPSKTMLFSSHHMPLTLRDAVKARRLITSSWYVERFGDVGLHDDQNAKSRYTNKDNGGRQSVSVNSGVTGDGADIRVIDDPVDASDSYNELALKSANEWYSDSFSTRITSPDYAPVVLIMQRFSLADMSSFLLDDGFYHLCLPMVADSSLSIKSTTPIEAWPDGMDGEWREDGELLFPEQWTGASHKKLQKTLGISASGQLQQNPTKAEGDIFKKSMFEYYEQVPYLENVMAFGDTAQSTSLKAAFTVFMLLGYNRNGIYVLDVVRKRLDADDLLKEGVAFWKKHQIPRLSNTAPHVFRIENKSSGIGLNQQFKKRGVPIDPIQRSTGQAGSKWERAMNGVYSLDGRKVYVPAKPTQYTDNTDWVKPLEDECINAEKYGDTKGFWDQVDTLSDGINEFFSAQANETLEKWYLEQLSG